MPSFGCWNGTIISPQYQSVRDIRDAVRALRPAGRWSLEWLVKAGEGGTWQSAWDPHPLAIDGPGKLADLRAAGLALSPRLNVVPYVVIRGRPEWNDAEWAQIVACAKVAGKVVLNLEEGAIYWNGPTDAATLTAEYILPLKARLAAEAPTAKLELCAIPRQWVVDALGGRDCLIAWAYAVQSMSWETYRLTAPDLNVPESMGRVMSWLEPTSRMWDRRWYIPVVEKGDVALVAATGYSRAGLQLWHLDGDI